MIPKELFQKVRRIQITTTRLVTDVFAGQYHSVFKGRGMEFDEVREYQVGDDIRTIDWNVTARTGKAHVKKFVEERELTVMFLVDASKSCRFSSVNELKSQLAAEMAAVLSMDESEEGEARRIAGEVLRRALHGYSLFVDEETAVEKNK